MENDPSMRVRNVRRNLFILEGLVVITMFLFFFFLVDTLILIAFLILMVVFVIILAIIIRHQKAREKLLSKKYPFTLVRTNRRIEAHLCIGETEKHEIELTLHRFSGKGELRVDGVELEKFTGWHWRRTDDTDLEIGMNEKHKIQVQGIGSTTVNIVADGTESFFFDVY